MNSGQLEAIADAVNSIDRQICQNFNPDTLSKEVGISQYHLHRLFRSITGKPLMAYVRGRRLSMSLKELPDTELSIQEISARYHFEHEQSYIRSFKRMFHRTPAQYRKDRQEVRIEQKIGLNHLQDPGQGLVIEPRTCLRSGFILQGLCRETVHENNLIHRDSNRQAEEFEKEYLPKTENVADARVYYGLTTYTEHPQYSNHYTTAVEVTGKNRVEPPLVLHEIPSLEYAVFRYIGLHSAYEVTFATLRKPYHWISQWKLDTDWRQTQPYHFERMDLKICSPTYCEMDIYVPVAAGK